MTTTLNAAIPQTTLQPGQTVLGPYPLANCTGWSLTIDRTVAGGLNSLDASTTVKADVYVTRDGGQTWTGPCGGSTTGGEFTNHRTGQPYTAAAWTGRGFATACDHIRVVVTIGGPSPVVVAGNVTAD